MRPLNSFVEEHLGRTVVMSRPRPSGMTRVVHVKDDSGREWFAKRLLARNRWSAEVGAYQLWRGLPGVLELAASCGDRQCLLLPKASGLQREHGSRRMLRSAGKRLRQLHSAEAPENWDQSWRYVAQRRSEQLIASLPRRGVNIDARIIRAATTELVDLPIGEVVTHGDYQPHNWYWRRQSFSVIDFESAAIRPAAFDFCRLRFALCWDRPDWFRSLTNGYGRKLSVVEERYILAAMPWRSLNAIDIGLRLRRDEMVAHGLRVLDSVRSDI